MTDRFRCAQVLCLGCALLFIVSLKLTGAEANKRALATLEIAFPNYSYPQILSSLRELDLANGEVIVFGKGGTEEDRFKLKNGQYKKSGKGGGAFVRYRWLKPLDAGTTGSQFAALYFDFEFWDGSTSRYGIVQLIELRQNHAVVVQQLYFNTRGFGQKDAAFFNPKTGLLTTRGLNSWEHCCPTRIDVVQFRLDEAQLKQIKYYQEPLTDLSRP